jgi:hypothetical protein
MIDYLKKAKSGINPYDSWSTHQWQKNFNSVNSLQISATINQGLN